jgi:hypothetical protein
MEEKTNNRKAEAFRVGLVVLILLATMTIGEYFIGSIAVGWSAPLWGIAILKAWLIIRDYMHFPRLLAGEEESHS